MENVKFESIKEIWEAIGRIETCISIIEGKLGIDNNINKTKEEINAEYKKMKEDYFNELAIRCQYIDNDAEMASQCSFEADPYNLSVNDGNDLTEVSKYNPIRSLANQPKECNIKEN